MDQNQTHDIQPIREIMSHDGDGNEQAHLGVDMKAQANPHAIKHTVKGEPRSAHQTDHGMPMFGIFMFMCRMDDSHLFQRMDRQKAQHERD